METLPVIAPGAIKWIIMGHYKTGSNSIEKLVVQIGPKGTCERLSGYISDICKSAPSSKEVDEIINLLLSLKNDVLEGRFNPAIKKER